MVQKLIQMSHLMIWMDLKISFKMHLKAMKYFKKSLKHCKTFMATKQKMLSLTSIKWKDGSKSL